MRRAIMTRLRFLVLVLALAAGLAPALSRPSFAAEEAPAASKGPSKLLGAPVNVNIAGGAILPEGKLLTALNWSLRDRTYQVHGDKANKHAGTPDIFSQVWLLKIRYGLFDRLEINTVTSYVNNQRDGMHPEHIEGLGDQPVGFSLAMLSERAGDPLWATFSGAVLLPTGIYGDNHPPGNGAWGGRAALSFTKMFTPNIRTDMDLMTQAPFERGNQKVKRGAEYQWNVQARYLFETLPVDIGLESSLTKIESGDKKLPNDRTINIYNGTTEWVVGPSFNVAIEPLGMWAGAGAFFPVMQEADSAVKMEKVRWEFKIAKIW